MPTVKDEQGNVVAKLPYNESGEAQAEKIVEANPNYEVVDARSRTDSYQLGGLIPGAPGFGQRPMVNPLGQSPIIKPPLSPVMEKGGEIPKYKKGGEVKSIRNRMQIKENIMNTPDVGESVVKDWDKWKKYDKPRALKKANRKGKLSAFERNQAKRTEKKFDRWKKGAEKKFEQRRKRNK